MSGHAWLRQVDSGGRCPMNPEALSVQGLKARQCHYHLSFTMPGTPDIADRGAVLFRRHVAVDHRGGGD